MGGEKQNREVGRVSVNGRHVGETEISKLTVFPTHCDIEQGTLDSCCLFATVGGFIGYKHSVLIVTPN